MLTKSAMIKILILLTDAMKNALHSDVEMASRGLTRTAMMAIALLGTDVTIIVSSKFVETASKLRMRNVMTITEEMEMDAILIARLSKHVEMESLKAVSCAMMAIQMTEMDAIQLVIPSDPIGVEMVSSTLMNSAMMETTLMAMDATLNAKRKVFLLVL